MKAEFFIAILSLVLCTGCVSVNERDPTGQDANASLAKGNAYVNGAGVAQDYGQAMVWFRKAADGGNSQAMYNVGLLYYKGLGVSQDYAQAMTWFQKSANAGDSDAMYNVGVFYMDGLGVPQDYAQAMTWFQRAANRGITDAIVNIGLLYYKGHGVAQDRAEAMVWFQKAAALGDAHAIKLIRELNNETSISPIVEEIGWLEAMTTSTSTYTFTNSNPTSQTPWKQFCILHTDKGTSYLLGFGKQTNYVLPKENYDAAQGPAFSMGQEFKYKVRGQVVQASAEIQSYPFLPHQWIQVTSLERLN